MHVKDRVPMNHTGESINRCTYMRFFLIERLIFQGLVAVRAMVHR